VSYVFTLDNLQQALSLDLDPRWPSDFTPATHTPPRKFLADFAGFPKSLQSHIIRLVAVDECRHIFSQKFAGQKLEQICFLGQLFGVLLFDNACLAMLVSDLSHRWKRHSSYVLFQFHSTEVPLKLALCIAELNSPTPVLVAPAEQAASPLAEAVERLGALRASRAQVPFGTVLME